MTRSLTSTSRLKALAVTATVVIVGAAAAVAQASSAGSPGQAPATAGAANAAKASPAPHGVAGDVIPGRYIVTVKDGANPASVAAIVGASPQFVYRDALNGFAAALNQGQLTALSHNGNVAAIEADQEASVGDYSQELTDAQGQPWGLDRIDQRTGLSRTYSYWANSSYGAGVGVRAYVIDTGIATADSDFGGRAQDVWDYYGGSGQDCNGHGTHVAGTIGGLRYGVAKAVYLRGVRIFDCTGHGTVSSMIAGINWVQANAIKPAVANLSGSAGYSAALNTAATNLASSGVFFAVAAGNNNGNACSSSPASAAGTLTVAASDSLDRRASFSNYGGCVDLYAPGVQIKSDWLNGGTNTIDGTSMATPHVTGVAALLKSDYGDQASSTINSWILNATTTNVIGGNLSGTANRLLYMSGW